MRAFGVFSHCDREEHGANQQVDKANAKHIVVLYVRYSEWRELVFRSRCSIEGRREAAS